MARSCCNHRSLFRWLFILVLSCAFCCVLPSPAQAQAPAVGLLDEVHIEGLTSHREETLLKSLKTKAGQPYNPLIVQEDLKQLSTMMRQASVETRPTDDGGLALYFVVNEFPRFRKLQVIGNSKLTNDRIESLLGLRETDVLDEKTQRGIVRSLTNEYRTAGLPQATVRIEVLDVPASERSLTETPEADLQVIINEGRQVLCQDVTIDGNNAFGDLRLKSQMETKGSWGFVNNYYDDATFEEDLKRIGSFYAANGYFDARIERGLFNETTVKGQPTISPMVKITEGERYRFGKALVSGARLFSHAEVVRPFLALEGKPFEGESFREALDAVRDLYLSHGLLTTEITPEYQYATDDQRIDVKLTINEDNRIYVGEIKVKRNQAYVGVGEDASGFERWYAGITPPVEDDVIAREVLLEPGKIYNKTLERETLRRLDRMGVFEGESLGVYNEPTLDPRVHNLVLNVQESVTGAISGGVGFGDGSGVYIFGQLSERNVRGKGDQFNTRIQLGTRTSSAVISFLDRHYNDGPDSMLYKAFYQNLRRPGYDAQEGGLVLEHGHTLASDWTRYIRGQVGIVALSKDSGIDAEEELDKEYFVSTLQLRFEKDTRWPLGASPREGWQQTFAATGGYAGGPLFKLEYMRDQYWPLPRLLPRANVPEDWTWRTNLFAGLIPYDRDSLPIHERFFLGGNSDLRGFAYRGADDRDPKDDDLPVGGNVKLLVKNELLYPIYDPVSGAFFVDAGILGRHPFSYSKPRVSTGAGLRLDVKRVQIALDLAIPVVTGSDDDLRFFHFSLKSQF